MSQKVRENQGADLSPCPVIIKKGPLSQLLILIKEKSGQIYYLGPFWGKRETLIILSNLTLKYTTHFQSYIL